LPLTAQIRHALALSLLGALPAVADTIYQTAGTESVQYAINTSEAIAISWTSTVGYSNVSIGVSLSDGLNTDTDVFEAGEAFLLDSIGSGTTEAAVLAYTTFNFPHGPQDQQLFAGVILNPGTYYLLLDSSSSVGGGWQATDTPDGLTVTTAPGVASNGDFYSLAVNQTFAPDSTFMSGLVYEPLLNVTGTLTTPEPPSGVLLITSFLALCVLRPQHRLF